MVADTSVTQSALEEALASRTQDGTLGSWISTIGQALRSRVPSILGTVVAEAPMPESKEAPSFKAEREIRSNVPTVKSLTATQLGSDFVMPQRPQPGRTCTVVTKITRTGASQDYPRCPVTE